MGQFLSIIDLFWLLALPIGFNVWARVQVEKNLASKPHYRFFRKALNYRLLMGMAFIGIYLFVYGGGDTINYWLGGNAMKNLLLQSPGRYLEMMYGEPSWSSYWNNFNADTGYPPTWLYRRLENVVVIRFASIPLLFTGGSLVGGNMIFAFFSFKAIWKLYEMFIYYFPKHEKLLSWSILFFPSVAFWGTGIMKDTLTMIGMGYFLYIFYRRFILRNISLLPFLFWLLVYGYIVYLVKPYVLIASAPALLIWLNIETIRRIKSVLIRVVVLPLGLIISILLGIVAYLNSGEAFGDYAPDTILERAAITQQDLVREEAYGRNNFDIGAFDPTLGGVLAKAPVAISAGLYRPFLWESGNIVMLFSGLENTFLLLVSLFLLIKLSPIGVFRRIQAYPLFFFCFIFSLLMAFSIGLTTANFGALVRYKIPLLPFYASMVMLMYRLEGSYKAEQKKVKEIKAEEARKAEEAEV